MVVGLTGKYCSGKSTVGSLFQEAGWHVIEVDALGHQALEALKKEVSSIFGDDILRDGRVDRSRLGRIVFKDYHKRLLLEGIVHPWMKQRCIDLVEKDKAKRIHSVINAALLHYMDLDSICDYGVYVRSPFFVRFYRGKVRDGTNFREFLQRERAQKHIHVYNITCRNAVFSIHNTGNRIHLKNQLEEMLHLIHKKDI